MEEQKTEQFPIGSTVRFGSYFQSNDVEKQKIEWIVLDKINGRMLLLSKKALAHSVNVREDNEWQWQTSSPRAWLNNEFLQEAFSPAEQALICSVSVPADANPVYKVSPGNATQDKLFLLSIAEAEKYFPACNDRTCSPTEYAVNQHVSRDGNNHCDWRLRTPGGSSREYKSKESFTIVDQHGKIWFSGYQHYLEGVGIRPAMWISMGETEGSDTQSTDASAKPLDKGESGSPAADPLRQDHNIGDIITMGRFFQNNDAKKEPLRWQVIAKRTDQVLLISEKAIDYRPLNENPSVGLESVVWYNCTLRSWLNDTFLTSAFNEEERKKIARVTMTVERTDHSESPVLFDSASKTAKDKIFILTQSEIEKHLKTEQSRRCVPTSYAEKKADGMYTITCTCAWWARTFAYNRLSPVDHAAIVDSVGDLGSFPVNNRGVFVRPVFWLNTGEVKEEETEKVAAKPKVQEKPKLKSEDFKKNDTVLFGRYPQEKDGLSKQPIEWIVLGKKDQKLLLLSKKVLDWMPFHENNGPLFGPRITWMNSSLRDFLNSSFTDCAFTEKEQSYIADTELPEYIAVNTKRRKKSQALLTDKVFLINREDLYKTYGAYGNGALGRISLITAYALEKFKKICPKVSIAETVFGKTFSWFLRDPGSARNSVAAIAPTGDCFEEMLLKNKHGIRPVLWLDIEAIPSEDIRTADSAEIQRILADSGKEGQTQPVILKLKRSPKAAFPGECITFGRYREYKYLEVDIKWIVLIKEHNRMLVLSRYGLGYSQYDDSSAKTGHTWESSKIRKWLNHDFYSTVFTPEEQKHILTTTVPGDTLNKKNPTLETKDKLFLLSMAEVSSLLDNPRPEKDEESFLNCINEWHIDVFEYWWLRTSTRSKDSDVPCVHGCDFYNKKPVLTFAHFGESKMIRPAMWIDTDF